MDSGMWVLGLAIIPIISFIVVLIIVIKSVKEKKISTINIILIIIIIFISPFRKGESKKVSYENVNEINFEVKQVNNWEFDIYFLDKNGNYYYAKEERHNSENEIDAYLLKSDKKKRVGLKLDLQTTNSRKVYICDNNKNRILVLDVDDYNDEEY